jgi:hypothetical protein
MRIQHLCRQHLFQRLRGDVQRISQPGLRQQDVRHVTQRLCNLRHVLTSKCRSGVQRDLPVCNLLVLFRIRKLQWQVFRRLRGAAWDGIELRFVRQCLLGRADVHEQCLCDSSCRNLQ